MNTILPKTTITIASLAVIPSALMGASYAFADSSSINHVTVSVGSSCTMRSSGNNSHTAEVSNGTYVSEIGTTTITAICNDAEGFSIYAVGFTGDEIGGTNSTKLVGASTGGLIATGTATGSNTNDPSNWAMKLATDSNATYPMTLQNGFGSYSAVPASYTKVATRASGTDAGTSATGATLTTTYAAYINSGQISDTYNGKVKYTLLHPASEEPLQPHTATSGCINYFAGVSTAIGTMGCQSISASDTEATLLASNFSRTGYGFAGWSDSYDYVTNPNAKFYGPQEDITFTAGQYTGTNNGLSLYAVWVKSAGSLQDTSMVATLCGTGTGSLTAAATDGTANLSSVSALTDQRDNQTYAIAKLADGKCWMIENLRLESTAAHNSDGTLAQGYGTSTTYGNFTGLADAESANFNDSTTANSLYYSGTQSGTASINIGTMSSPGYRMPRYNNLNTQNRASSPTSNSFPDNNTDGGVYSYGNYYAWHAAIANTAFISYNANATTSLCPTGWRLPSGAGKGDEDNNDYWALIVVALNNDVFPANYDSSSNPYFMGNSEAKPIARRLRAYPNNFLYSGSFDGSSTSNRGSVGRYWTSTFGVSLGSAYQLSISHVNNTFIVEPADGGSASKLGGASIRCIASEI